MSDISESAAGPAAEPFAEYKVPDEPGVWFCPRHKGVTTRLRCGRCEKPICPKCTVMAPTGARCRDCASNRSSHIYQVRPLHLVLAGFGAACVGSLGALLLSALGSFSLWLVLYAAGVGPAVGRLVTRLTGGKRGPVLAGTVCGGLVAGGVVTKIIAEFSRMRTQSMLPPELAPMYAFDPISWGFLVLFLFFAIGGAWWWLK